MSKNCNTPHLYHLCSLIILAIIAIICLALLGKITIYLIHKKQYYTQLSQKYILKSSLINRRRRGRENFPLTAHTRPRAHSPVTGVACSPVEGGRTDITGGQYSRGKTTLNRVTPKILALEEDFK